MLRPRLLATVATAASMAALVLPTAGWAGGSGGPAVSESPITEGRALEVRRFELAGVRWRGAGSVELRARRLDGTWTAWYAAAPEPEDRPDRGAHEARRRQGWQLGNPWWVGPADRIQVRTEGRVTAVRAITVASPERRVPLRRAAATSAPAVVPRSFWGADESIVRSTPTYAAETRFAMVHHTAGQNAYTRSEAPAIVRGIQLYHVKSNGWNDIGYNFLVDRFGVVYEGRAGGIDKNVVGAHALGFNTGSVGVALLGTHTSAPPSAAAEKAIADVIAWRLDLAHVDPLTTLTVVSNGSERFPSGLPVFLRAVSGHRDTGLTTCPGDSLYQRLGALAALAQANGLPKLFEPTVEGSVGGQVSFRARLSEALSWTITIADPAGTTVSTLTGFGALIEAGWDATTAPPGPYTWKIEAGTGSRVVSSAAGAVGGGGAPSASLAFSGASAEPETVSPNADGQADTATVTYTLTTSAAVGAVVVDLGGAPVAELERPRWRKAGEHVLTFDPAALPDGRYAIHLEARAQGGLTATSDVPVAVTRTLGSVTAATAVISPNADGRQDAFEVSFALAQPADVKLSVRRGRAWIATPFAGRLEAGTQLLRWDGTKRIGRLRDGAYDVVLEVTDTVATSAVKLGLTSDTRAPVIRVATHRPARLWVSEPAELSLVVNGSRRRLAALSAGEVRVPGIARLLTLRARARDAAGNESPLLVDRQGSK